MNKKGWDLIKEIWLKKQIKSKDVSSYVKIRNCVLKQQPDDKSFL